MPGVKSACCGAWSQPHAVNRWREQTVGNDCRMARARRLRCWLPSLAPTQRPFTTGGWWYSIAPPGSIWPGLKLICFARYRLVRLLSNRSGDYGW